MGGFRAGVSGQPAAVLGVGMIQLATDGHRAHIIAQRKLRIAKLLLRGWLAGVRAPYSRRTQTGYQLLLLQGGKRGGGGNASPGPPDH